MNRQIPRSASLTAADQAEAMRQLSVISEAQERGNGDSIIVNQRAAHVASLRALAAIGVELHELQRRAAGRRRRDSSVRVWTTAVQLQLRKNVRGRLST